MYTIHIWGGHDPAGFYTNACANMSVSAKRQDETIPPTIQSVSGQISSSCCTECKILEPQIEKNTYC